MKYKDLHTWAWLNGFYERWNYGDGFGRSHDTDQDWNEAYDSGANASDFLTENWGWLWKKLLRPFCLGVLLICCACMGLAGLYLLATFITLKGLAIAFVMFLIWLIGHLWELS